MSVRRFFIKNVCKPTKKKHACPLTRPPVCVTIWAYDTLRHSRSATARATGRGKEMRGSSAATAIAVIARGRASVGMLTEPCRETVLGQREERL